MRDVRFLYGIPVCHVLLGLAVCGFSAWVHQRLPRIALEFLPLVAAVGVLTAQAALLGFWAAFSDAKPGARIVGLIAGACWLEALLRLAGEGHVGFHGLTATAVVVSAGALWYVRIRKARLDRVAGKPDPTGGYREGLRFSIRGLMLFTMAVALVVGGARSMRRVFDDGPPVLPLIAIWAICFAACGLAAAWAALGLRRPFGRGLAVLLMAAVLGGLFGYGVGTDSDEWEVYCYFVIVMLLDALLVFLTLLVVRSAGYRLVPRADPVKSGAEKGEAIEVVFG